MEDGERARSTAPRLVGAWHRILGVVVAAIALGTLGVGPADARADARPLRVVTFNLLHGGPWSEWNGDDQHLERRLEHVAEALERIQPDIVALQEASVGRRRGNVAERLARRLGLHVTQALATERVFGSPLIGRPIVWLIGFNEGPAVLSRFPIVATEVIDLPRCQVWYDPRVVLAATLRTPAGDIRVYSTHTRRDDCQIEAIGRAVADRRNGLPSLVMGDLNTVESAPAMQALGAAGFVDTFRRANPDTVGATVWQPVRSPVKTVSRRVDYIWMLPGLDVDGRVAASRVVLDTPIRLPDGGTLWPSDHHGVLAEITLTPPVARRRDDTAVQPHPQTSASP